MMAMDTLGTKGQNYFWQYGIAALTLLATPSTMPTACAVNECPDTTCACAVKTITTDINSITAGKTNKQNVIPQKKNYVELYKKFTQSTLYQKTYYDKSLGDVITIED